MNTEIQTFTFNAASVRVLTDEASESWFVAKDVCNVLELNNVSQALSRLDDDEKQNIILNDGISRNPNRAIVSESGLYALILASRKPEACKFKRWITHEVLPQIRKTGGYIPSSEADSDEDIMAKALLIAQKTVECNALQLRARDKRIMELESKAQALDDFTNVEDRLLVRDAAKILSNAGTPISEKQLREWMTDNDWIYKASGSWHATAKHCTAGHLVMVMSTKHGTKADGTKFAYPPTVCITRKGLALLHKRLGENLLAEALQTANN